MVFFLLPFPFQSYYLDYYSRYLEDYEAKRLAAGGVPNGLNAVEASLIGPLEASLVMDDIMSNGRTFCSIM